MFLFAAIAGTHAQVVNVATSPWIADTAAVFSDPIDNWAKDPSVIKYGNTFYMYFTSANPWPPDGGIGPSRIDYATSPDGMKWTYKGVAIPRGDSGTWNEERSQAPSKPMLKDGIWYMFFAGARFGKAPMVGYATSTNLVNWTEFKSNPMIANAKWNDPFLYLENGIYYLSYNDNIEAIWYLTSTNLKDWDTTKAIRTDAVGEGNIIFKDNGKYMRFGATGHSHVGEYYHSAYSDNMVNFTKVGKITMNIPTWASGAFGHGDIIQNGNEYWFYFQGTRNNGVIFQIGLARQKIETTHSRKTGSLAFAEPTIVAQKFPNGYSFLLPGSASNTSPYSVSILSPAGQDVFKFTNSTSSRLFWNTSKGEYAEGLYILKAQMPDKSVLSKQVMISR